MDVDAISNERRQRRNFELWNALGYRLMQLEEDYIDLAQAISLLFFGDWHSVSARGRVGSGYCSSKRKKCRPNKNNQPTHPTHQTNQPVKPWAQGGRGKEY
jgi:hypothetical protein